VVFEELTENIILINKQIKIPFNIQIKSNILTSKA